MGWARVIRGIDSIANATTPREASCSIPAASVSGCRNAIRMLPLPSRSASPGLGFATFTTVSADHGSPTVAPAST